jgi:hypothetical protein
VVMIEKRRHRGIKGFGSVRLYAENHE